MPPCRSRPSETGQKIRRFKKISEINGLQIRSSRYTCSLQKRRQQHCGERGRPPSQCASPPRRSAGSVPASGVSCAARIDARRVQRKPNSRAGAGCLNSQAPVADCADAAAVPVRPDGKSTNISKSGSRTATRARPDPPHRTPDRTKPVRPRLSLSFDAWLWRNQR